MTTHVDVFVGPAHDLVHTSLVLTGLCALAARGDIGLRYRTPGAADGWLTGDPTVIVFDVHGTRTTRIAIDLRDGEGISRPIVDRVEWYFKRAYYPPERERHADVGHKFLPFGLNYPCRSARSTARLLAHIGVAVARTGRPGLSRLQHYLGTPAPHAFEQGPDVAVEPWVVFQPRVWADGEVAAGEAEPLNAERVALVRRLKREFGKRFIGGLVPTALAKERYPDALTPHPSRPADYHRLKKRCLINIYTRGVEHSLAFKLGEAFASSQCLVSVPLRYEVPVSIDAGRHYLEFETPDACVSACHRLFDDRSLAQSMRNANHQYYVREIEPAAHLARVLARVAAEAGAI